jgi:hypothetical protein
MKRPRARRQIGFYKLRDQAFDHDNDAIQATPAPAPAPAPAPRVPPAAHVARMRTAGVAVANGPASARVRAERPHGGRGAEVRGAAR